MGRLRSAIAAAAVGAAIAAQGAVAQDTPDQPPPPVTAPPEPPSGTQPPGGLEPVNPAPKPKPKPKPRPDQGKPPPKAKPDGGKGAKRKRDRDRGKTSAESKLPPLSLGTVSCGTGAPSVLIPIYREASQRYGLGSSGPSILAAINEIESGFGANMGPSSAGAIGWMQFMPATWEAYGVDADDDGHRNPWDPEDAIFAAARYLSASGMPEDPEGAIWAYNHADWYVAEVLARATCFQGLGGGFAGGVTLLPEQEQLSCVPSEKAPVPKAYLEAFQDAATRYELGERGVWAMAAVARLESDFGRGMSSDELTQRGPLGIDEANWERFAVDGDRDGSVSRPSPADSAATLGRMVWASGDLEAGIFLHNHAAWYVEEVLDQTARGAGECRVHAVSYSIALPGPTGAPVNWENVKLSNALQAWDLQRGAIDPRVMALIAAISREHEVLISSLRSDHSMSTSSGNLSNHYFGRAMDIAAIDGVSCTVTGPDDPCGRLARAIAGLPLGERPTELIYCFDPDGPGRAFAQADHCDHIHAGFDS